MNQGPIRVFYDKDHKEDPSNCDPLILAHFDPISDSLSPRSQLMALKSPLVLHMLNRRFKGILPKIIHSIAMMAISAELPKGLSTHKFFGVAKDILKHEDAAAETGLKAFETQWIDSSGCPRFTVKWAFNKKRMEVDFEVEQENTNAKGKWVAKHVQVCRIVVVCSQSIM